MSTSALDHGLVPLWLSEGDIPGGVQKSHKNMYVLLQMVAIFVRLLAYSTYSVILASLLSTTGQPQCLFEHLNWFFLKYTTCN